MLKNKQLKYEDRIKTLENQMAVTKNTEKQLEAKIKQEIKTVNKTIKALESSVPVQLHKKCKPIEDKINIMLETVDDLENELENITSSNKKLSSEMPHRHHFEDASSSNNEKSSPRKPEPKQSRVTLLNQLLDNELEVLKKQYNDRFEKLEKALAKGAINPSSDYEKFLSRKDSNTLFEENDHKQREDFAMEILKNKELRKKVVQNDMV